MVSNKVGKDEHLIKMRKLIQFPDLAPEIRQNGAPSGLEKRGLDASIYHKTRKPTEGTQ
ncbi:hypothetical protein IQA64_17930 [Leptospira borgpetersenii serovar Tarassovi]|nr:hypothetical protein [Leptospira borgpetersenii serovar Tarassovi]